VAEHRPDRRDDRQPTARSPGERGLTTPHLAPARCMPWPDPTGMRRTGPPRTRHRAASAPASRAGLRRGLARAPPRVRASRAVPRPHTTRPSTNQCDGTVRDAVRFGTPPPGSPPKAERIHNLRRGHYPKRTVKAIAWRAGRMVSNQGRHHRLMRNFSSYLPGLGGLIGALAAVAESMRSHCRTDPEPFETSLHIPDRRIVPSTQQNDDQTRWAAMPPSRVGRRICWCRSEAWVMYR